MISCYSFESYIPSFIINVELISQANEQGHSADDNQMLLIPVSRQNYLCLLLRFIGHCVLSLNLDIEVLMVDKVIVF